jgi:hypothetical protein
VALSPQGGEHLVLGCLPLANEQSSLARASTALPFRYTMLFFAMKNIVRTCETRPLCWTYGRQQG